MLLILQDHSKKMICNRITMLVRFLTRFRKINIYLRNRSQKKAK